MPEYLAPGVYVEETSFRSKSIEGVSTTTTAFVGPTRYGPLDIEPDIITSMVEFERIYGDRQRLEFSDDGIIHNYMWHAVRAFFEEGGKRLYVARVFREFGEEEQPPDGWNEDGRAKRRLPMGVGNETVDIEARFPGSAGNIIVRITVRLGQNILGRKEVRDAQGELVREPDGTLQTQAAVSNLTEGDIVWISDQTSPISSPPGAGALFIATSAYDPTKREVVWTFRDHSSPTAEMTLDRLTVGINPEKGDQIRVVTLAVTAILQDGTALVWDGLSPTPEHVRNGVADSLDAKFHAEQTNLGLARALPIVVKLGDDLKDGLDVLNAIFAADSDGDLRRNIDDLKSSEDARSVEVLLAGGNDGQRPLASDYEGQAKETEKGKTGLKALEALEDISIIAAPGATYGYEASDAYKLQANTIVNLLLSHAARMKYRIAVLDSGNDQTIAQVRAMRAKIDSTYGALYYPWVKLLDPVTQTEIAVPPSGHVAGIYARNDINRAVYKAPANEVVNLAIGFETLLNKAQQEVLNPEGVNCFRFFEGRGFRLWGARTVSSDPEWKYVNLRRYFCYLGRSIDRGTQWAVFEPNGDALWRNVRETIQDFLFNEWVSGALLGDDPKKAYFVKCDRSTMTQNDLDNGRLICLIGVAVVKPAEFVIFRIGQWTADRKV